MSFYLRSIYEIIRLIEPSVYFGPKHSKNYLSNLFFESYNFNNSKFLLKKTLDLKLTFIHECPI